jgi:hypothetical protein
MTTSDEDNSGGAGFHSSPDPVQAIHDAEAQRMDPLVRKRLAELEAANPTRKPFPKRRPMTVHVGDLD